MILSFSAHGLLEAVTSLSIMVSVGPVNQSVRLTNSIKDRLASSVGAARRLMLAGRTRCTLYLLPSCLRTCRCEQHRTEQ